MALELVVEKREECGTGAARSLRRKSIIPGIVYGAGHEPIAIAIKESKLVSLSQKKHFISTVIDLQIGEKEKYRVLPKAIDYHPVTDVIRHIDFVIIAKSEHRFDVPLVFEGKENSVAIKQGGFFNIVKRRLDITAPSDNIPSYIAVDVSNISSLRPIKLSNIVLPKGCRANYKEDILVASLIGSRGSKTEEEAAAA